MEDGTRWSSNLGGELAKDGRKISVGDCALFQAINAPPFIGIIRSLLADADGNAKLGVNWLYRPPDVKLGKGVLLEAAPNEIFYSFHKDEIPATSLLHPCKVAFLRKGVELPPGVSSFVCRRVYDTASKCLWWLTDRDYSDEHQEEVDQLLNRTRHEMQAALQAGGPSPRALNAHVSSQELKSGSENIHTAACFSQGKIKKRECSDQNPDHVKKERSSKPDDVDAVPFKWERTARPGETTTITDMDRSLTSSAGVERLVHLMQQDLHDSMKRGNELTSWRTMIVGVIANTDQDDCLNLFVQLGGLIIMDDWLQVAHKGKGGEGGSPREGDKIDEELLLILLRALEKLPVDLNALKQCNVGKSVNHLRNHKNVEIKKRARCLVDAWKKRVAAEMKNSDTNSGSSQCISWPCKQAMGEEIHLQCKGGGATEAILKSSLPLPSGIKPISNRSGHTDIMQNSTSAHPGSDKVSSLPPSTQSSKDSPTKVPFSTGITNLTVTVVNEDKSSSSSQSHNNSHSGSSWPGKGAGSAWREDPKNSTAGLTTAKASSKGQSYKSSCMSILRSGTSGNQKETRGGKSHVQNKITVDETASHSGLMPVEGVDSGCGDDVASQRMIIRLPNSGHSLICGMPEEHDTNNVFHANTAPDINTELRQHMYTKSGVAGRDESALEVEGCSFDCQEAGKPMEICKMDQPSVSGLGKQIDSEEVLIGTENVELSAQDGIPSSFVKSCSKTTESAEAGVDENRISLPEGGARTENFKVDQVPVAGKSERASVPAGEGDFSQEAKLRQSTEGSSHQLDNNAVDDSTVCVKKENDDAISMDDPDAASSHMTASTSAFGLASQYEDGSGLSTRAVISIQNTDLDTNAPLGGQGGNPSGKGNLSEHNSAGNGIAVCPSSNQEALVSMEETFGSGGKLNVAANDEIADALTELVTAEPFSVQQARDDRKQLWLDTNNTVAEKDKQDVDASLGDVIKDGDITGGEKTVVNHSMGTRTLESDVNNTTKGIAEFTEDFKEVALQFAKKVDQNVGQGGKPLGSTSSHKDDLDTRDCHQCQNDVVKDSTAVGAKRHCNSGNEIKDGQKAENPGYKDLLDDDQQILTDKKEDTVVEKATEPGTSNEVEQASCISDSASGKIVATIPGPGCALDGCDKERRSDIHENEFSRLPSKFDICMVGPTVDVSSGSLTQPIENLSGESAHAVELNAAENLAREVIMCTESSTIGSDLAIRPEFDLNEGIAMDEANQDEAAIHTAASASSVLFSSSTASNTIISSGLTTPIAAVAVTKGPFILSVNPLQSKVEMGWKGSAATSAFQPAEPQRTLERQHSTSESELVDEESNAMEKQNRPHLDIDLNITDKIAMEDVGIASALISSQKLVPVSGSERTVICSQELMVSTGDQSTIPGPLCNAGRLSFDLNCVDEGEENVLITAPLARSPDNLGSSFKTISSGSSRILRDFDLNDGPSFEDAKDGHTSQEFNAVISGSSSLHAVTGTKENEELVNVSSWFPHGNTFSALAIPLCSARIEQPFEIGAAAAGQSVSGSAGGHVSFSGDMYKREPVLAPAHPVTYSKSVTASFPYTRSPFGLNIPSTSMPSGGTPSVSDSSGLACFAAVSSEYAGAVSSAYPRSYLNLTNSSGMVYNNTWRTQDFDLNAGPETVDMEGREAVASMHPFTTDTQVSLEHKEAFFPAATSGVSLKRKEPEGGWDLCKNEYRKSTWQ